VSKPPESPHAQLLTLADRREWREWLSEHHGSSAGVWVAIGKKGGTATALTYDDAVGEALCFGWIDSISRSVDDHRFAQRFTPRRPGGNWSRSNKKRVERLIEQGLMAPAGLAAVEAAKNDGSWSLLDDVEALVVPDDLAQAFASNERARVFFEKLNASRKRAILYWIATAKRESTRQRRIKATIESAVAGHMPIGE